MAIIAATAVFLRLYRADTVLRSLDYADLPFRVAHYWGWWWIAENPYGPIQPLVTKLWALIVTSLGLPMTERLWRVPAAILGSITPLLAYALLRKLRIGRAAAWTAAALLAVGPFTVSADRYPYSSESYGLFFALLAFLAALRHVERPSPRRATMVGLALAAYFLSHLLVHAVPVTLLYLLVRSGRQIARFRWPLLAPPMLAIAMMTAAHGLTGQGQVGHLLFKRQVDTTGVVGPADWAQHAAWLVRQFGWGLAPVAGIALILAAREFATAKRRRLTVPPLSASEFLVFWAIAFLAPMVCLQHYYGRMYGYYVQGCAALLCLACAAFDHLLRYRAAKLAAALVVTYVAVGTISTVFLDDRLFALTGVKCPIGAATRDPGYKAAGWYVRTHVPPDAVVFTPHEMAGLEYMPAAYYMGRHCLAGENFTREQMRRVYDAFATRIDAAVVEPAFDAWFSADAAWRCVACVVDGEVVLLRVYARAGVVAAAEQTFQRSGECWNSADRAEGPTNGRAKGYGHSNILRNVGMSSMRLPVGDYNTRFDRQFGPRRIPTMLPAPANLPRPSEIQRAATGGGEP